MKKIKMAIARFFWKREVRSQLHPYGKIALVTGVILMSGGGILAVKFDSFLLLTIMMVAGGFLATLPLLVAAWQGDLPEYKLDRAIRRAEALLNSELFPPPIFKAGRELISLAQTTGNIDQLKRWSDALAEYKKVDARIHELKALLMKTPEEIIELRGKLTDLLPGLENT